MEDQIAEAPNKNLNFGIALRELKEGKKVAREGWNGKGMFLLLVSDKDYFLNDSFALNTGLIDKEKFEASCTEELPNSKIGGTIQEGIYSSTIEGRIGLYSWIGMKTADKKFVPWLASQTDVLAEDWVILY